MPALCNMTSDGPDKFDRFNFPVGRFIFGSSIGPVGGLFVNHYPPGTICIDNLVIDAQCGEFTVLTCGQPPLVAIAKGQSMVTQPWLARYQVRGSCGDRSLPEAGGDRVSCLRGMVCLRKNQCGSCGGVRLFYGFLSESDNCSQAPRRESNPHRRSSVKRPRPAASWGPSYPLARTG